MERILKGWNSRRSPLRKQRVVRHDLVELDMGNGIGI